MDLQVQAFVSKGDIFLCGNFLGRDPEERVWTFSSSLMFSLAIFTTIGYGNLVPRTPMGKIVTMLYALGGIPIMLIYVATIGTILAKGFKYLYTKLCRCEDHPTDLPKKATLPSVQTDTMSISEEDFNQGARSVSCLFMTIYYVSNTFLVRMVRIAAVCAKKTIIY